MSDTLQLTVEIVPDGRNLAVTGRDAWALRELHRAGAKGVTPIDTPGPRWSGYVYNLRKLGLVIETVHERHDGAFPGTHARYVLHTELKVREARDGRSAA